MEHAAREVLARQVAETRRALAVLAANTGNRKYITKRLFFKRALYLQEMSKRDRFYMDLARYLVMLVLLISVVLSLQVRARFAIYAFPYARARAPCDSWICRMRPRLQTVQSNEVSQSFNNIFFSNVYPVAGFPLTFFAVGADYEWWGWAQGPLLDGLYGANAPGEGRLVGAPRLRQSRVRPMRCGVLEELYGAPNCLPEYSPESASVEPYGLDPTSGGPFAHTSTGSELLSSAVYNQHTWNSRQSYGPGGFVVLLPLSNGTRAREILAALRAGGYFDWATRALSVEFTYYLPSVDLFVAVQALIEMSPTRWMELSPRVVPVRLVPSGSAGGFVAEQWIMLLLICSLAYARAYAFPV